MIISSLILVEGKGVKKEDLPNSLMNAKHLVIGHTMGAREWIVQIDTNTLEDREKALDKFAKAPGVTGVVTVSIKNRP